MYINHQREAHTEHRLAETGKWWDKVVREESSSERTCWESEQVCNSHTMPAILFKELAQSNDKISII